MTPLNSDKASTLRKSSFKKQSPQRCEKPFSLSEMTEEDAWCILNMRINKAMLARWQILKAAARDRNYVGPTDNAAIAKDPEQARSDWIAWLQSDRVHLDWLRVYMHTLLQKEKFGELRELIIRMSRPRPKNK